MSRCHMSALPQALQSSGSWGAMEKWLKGMEKEVDVVVKDTWVDLTAPHTEGMILNYLRLKGVQGVTCLLFEGLVVGPASPTSTLSTSRSSGHRTVYNRSFWGVPTLALAHKSMARSVNKYDHSHPVPEGVTVPKLEPVTREVYQERMLTRSWLYPFCAPIYEFSCVYEALVAIADCIRSHGQAFSPYIISEGGNETDELFPISFMQADTSMWNMGLVRPAMSDWGYIDHTRIDPSNIRRGLLYDHAFASWNTRSTSMRGRPPSKIFAKHAGTALTLSSQDEALHFDDSLVHHPAHSPAHASLLVHQPHQQTSPPIPHSDAPSMSIIPSAPPTSMIPSQPASTAPSRGRRGMGKGKGKQGGRKGTDGRKSTPGAVNAPPDSSAATCKRGFDSISQGKPADGPSKRQAPLHHVPKVNIKPKHVVQSLQVDVAGYSSLNIDDDLERFKEKGGIYELTGTRAWMAIQMMFAQQPGQDNIRREIAHDLEGYYYVLLTLAFMFDAPYGLKKVPHPDTASGGEMWVHRWLENTIEKEIWHEAVEKQHYPATDAGFGMVDGVLGNDWANEPHSRMLDIINTALFKLHTDRTLAHLCQPQQMTNEWARAVGGGGFAKRSQMLPALRMNLLYHKDRQNADLNLFARMPCPPVQECKLTPGNSSQYLKGTGGRQRIALNVMAAPVVLKELRKEWAS
ncbi:uncharacterized protein EDB91DRAFT_1257199 [Suillus paluster]|uniref:uncharacterized protein n=1 Tax=Suillus paluster TaxID=48578 RepID=UPI001B870202|nr:uncharacterized protein EDB91DRAFT_1257199 [Suillus paluster]KAG1720070.1 hypothetical protein EDB91DRAFT_1257199 [Suillus paluster]